MTEDRLLELVCGIDENFTELKKYVLRHREEREDEVIKDAPLEALVGELYRRGYDVEYLLDEQRK